MGIALAAVLGAAQAQEGHSAAEPTHFPIHKPHEMDWSFAGPFGTYDKQQLQRGLKVYKEVCSACHSRAWSPSARWKSLAIRRRR